MLHLRLDVLTGYSFTRNKKFYLRGRGTVVYKKGQRVIMGILVDEGEH